MDTKAMHRISYGLYVVTAFMDGQDSGCITNTVGQVTSKPNRISVTVNKGNFTHEMIQNTGKFNVSVISRAAEFALFRRFGFQSGRDTDKFADYTAFGRSGDSRAYVTEGTNAWLEAKVAMSVDLGTHTMFIADVTDMEVLSSEPSCTYEYYLSNIKPKPQAVGTTPNGQTVWRCVICGYEYVGEELPEDFICPICKHPASDFEKAVNGSTPAPEKPAAGKKVWRCKVCGYEYEGEKLPADYQCPVCGEGPDEFEIVS
ncbi:MAG: flavin reductase [Ruminococcus sp.]|nr:flavin reductase [Ruminococcus sp.]